MTRSIARLALVVRDYDEAITFFTKALRFSVVEDTPLGDGKRWVRVAPANSRGAELLLAHATTPEQFSSVGHQSGGRVFLFLETDDFHNDYEYMKEQGVQFLEQPRSEPYGRVVVFVDLYGNKWDLLQPSESGLKSPTERG
jgi:catechol 2,3-dioxygenase-like lactoylglutathione lyase family enzyme